MEAYFVFQEHNRSKLTQIVADVETIGLAFYVGVAARDRDVIDSNFALVATTQLEFGAVRGHTEHVNVSGGVLVQRH